jgi:hypothetical protein
MGEMFDTPINRQNVSGLEVADFSAKTIQGVCSRLREQYPENRVVPVAVVPMSKHTSDEETASYYAAKHAYVSNGFASQFVDRKRVHDRNLLKWSISNIALALFAKMGGVPWRVRPSTTRCLIVGIGQAHRVIDHRTERFVAYSVLTDSSGAYETIKILGNSQSEEEYIASLRANLRQVLLSHANQYDSFVLHLTFRMRRREIQTIQALLKELQGENTQQEFVAIKFNDKNDFFGFSVDHNSRVPFEGTVAPLSRRDFLMWFSGLSIDNAKVPRKPERPVHLSILYPETTLSDVDLKRVLQDAMNIAGTNWRGFNAKSLPISIYYAKIIATYYGRFREAGLRDIDLEGISPWFL